MLRVLQQSRFLTSSIKCLSAAAPATAPQPINKEALMKLRKRTGYSYVNCKKALVEFGPDRLQEAEQWLRKLAEKEGWAKAAKLSSRATTQGLVGVVTNKKVAAVVDLSCETDFVARGDNFKALLETLTTSVLAQTGSTTNSTDKLVAATHDLDSLATEKGQKLREVLAMAVGKLGENLNAKRVLTFSAPQNSEVYVSSHPKEGNDTVAMGRFVSIVALRRTPQATGFPTDKLAAQLCQHIIGMRSETLGTPPSKSAPVKEKATESGDSTKPDELNDFFEGKTTEIDENETALLRQAFMLNPSQTVYDYVTGHGAEVVDFARVELGGESSE